MRWGNHSKYRVLIFLIGASVLLVFTFLLLAAQEKTQPASHDAVMDAQQPQAVPANVLSSGRRNTTFPTFSIRKMQNHRLLRSRNYLGKEKSPASTSIAIL